MHDHVWIVGGEFERPQKEKGFLSLSLGKIPSRRDSVKNLRISTHSKPDLHDRYMSSEEELSPSPDSKTASDNDSIKVDEEDLTLKEAVGDEERTDRPAEVSVEEYEPEIAVAVPIMAMGRPKLVDVSSLAPVQKWKRSSSEYPHQSTSSASLRKFVTPHDGFSTLPSRRSQQHAAEEHQAQRQPKHKPSFRVVAPASWLPADEPMIVEDEDYSLPLRIPPSYNDYDPYSLHPPRLPPRIFNGSPSKKPGSVAHAKKMIEPHTLGSSVGWTRVDRTLVKRQEPAQPLRQLTRKPKMLARGPRERMGTPIIPAFLPAGLRP